MPFVQCMNEASRCDDKGYKLTLLSYILDNPTCMNLSYFKNYFFLIICNFNLLKSYSSVIVSAAYTTNELRLFKIIKQEKQRREWRMVSL